MVNRGGQVSTEFIILFSLLIIFLVPMAYLILHTALQSTEQVSYARIDAIFSEIATEAREVYFRGAYSKIVVSANIPRNIEEVGIVEAVRGDETKYFFRVRFYAERQIQETIVPVEVPLYAGYAGGLSSSPISCSDGFACSVYVLPEGFASEGLRHIQISNVYDDNELKVRFDIVVI